MSEMRFAYLDREGREVRLPGAEAVKAGIRHGTIAPGTLLFDAEVGGWARADCHPFYQEVMDEEPDAGPAPEDSGSPDSEDASIEELWRTPARFREGDEEPGDSAEDAVAASFLDGLDEIELKISLPDPEELSGEEAEVESRGAPGGEDEGTRLSGSGHLILDLDGGRPRPPEPQEPQETEEAEQAEDGMDTGGDEPGAPSRPARSRPVASRRQAGPGTSDGPVERRPGKRSRSWVREPAVVIGALTILAGVVTAAGVLRSQDEPVRENDRAEVTATATASDARAREDSILDLIRPAGLAARVLRVMERADADVAAALAERAARDSLPAAPPDAWLEGAYLANAGAYPEVPEYWRAVERWSDELRWDLPRLVRESYQGRLEEGGFTERTGALLLEEALEDFHARAGRRDAAFEPLDSLIHGALDLHRILVEHADEIEYEPFSRDRISRDPILEAVASNPQLEEELWTRLTRITRALETMESLDAPTTDRVQGWLVGRLRASLGSPGSPAGEAAP